MIEIHLFVDGSVDPLAKVGYGAYLMVAEPWPAVELLPSLVNIKKFASTSSTRLELQTLLWALAEIPVPVDRVKVYTDSQNIVGLPGRRERLSQADYFSRGNRRLTNYELYQEFYRMIEHPACEFVKVSGHLQARAKDRFDHLFTLVDRASRRALREARPARPTKPKMG